MEREEITTSKIVEWVNDISTENELEKTMSYGNIPLWGFYEPQLCFLVNNYIKGTRIDNDIINEDTPKFILKFANYYFISKAIARFILGEIITNRIKHKHSENNSTCKILALSYTNYWKNYPTPQKENKRVYNDTMLGDIITTLKTKTFDVVALDIDPTFFIDLKTMIEKYIWERGLWRPAEVYLTPYIIRKALKATKKYEEKWYELKNKNKFCDNYYNGIQMSELLCSYIEKVFNYRTLIPILYIELMQKVIEVEKPDLILMTCGTAPLGRAAVIAGKLKGVPTLEIQHGVIHPDHFDYILPKDAISLERGAKLPCCPIPDKTAVYGQYHKELLTKVSTYQENSVVVTGQPRYDAIYYADKIYSKKRFLDKYNINPAHKVILWATQCLSLSNEENIKNFEVVFDTMQTLRDMTLIIKHHPREGKIYTKMSEEYLDRYKINAVITPNNSDTYEQLFICDLMITRTSTTAMEAVAFNKPVIILNLSGEPDPVEYVKEGVALGVYNEDDLKPMIEKLLKDDSELAKNREIYVENYLYKIDGAATERVVNLITQMIEEGREKNET